MRVGGVGASARSWRRLLVGVIAVLTTLTSSACSRMGDLTGPTPIGGSVVSVELSSSTLTMGLGTTVSLQATGRDRDNQPITDRPVVWSSSDSAVVRVSSSGVLTARNTGAAQISASIAGRSAVAQVTVIARPVASIEIGPLAPRVRVGGFVQLVAIPRDETGAPLSGRVVLWSSSDATIANVDATGFLRGLRAGAATITARSETREAAVGVIVTAIPVASVVVTPRVDTIVVGQTTQLAATPRDSQTVPLVDRAIAWRSSSNAIATVSASGLVIGVTPGTVTVSAETDNVSGTATVVVRPRPIGAVIVSPAQATLTIGQSTALTVQVTDQNGNLLTGRAITYATENSAIAQVTSDGVVRAVGVGTTNIRVTSEGRTGLMNVTVLPTPVASVRIEPATLALRIGGSVTLSAAALDAGGNVLAQRAVAWSSGAPTVFSVDASGVVRALSAGTGLVFAVIDGRLASASVLVTREPVSVVQVSPPALGLLVGGTFNLTATARDASGAVINRPVVWSSSNPLVAVVSSTGTVRALALGSARIDATVDGVVGSTAITVAPVPVANVRVTLTDSTLNVGQTVQAVAVLRSASDSLLTGRVVVWTSSAPAVATVSAAGVVTGVSGGSANIVATSEGISGSVPVTVSQVPGSLVIPTQPAGAVSGSAFTTQPVIRILDAQGNLVTTGPGATAAVTASKGSGSATLSGTLTVNAVGGIATFTTLSFTGTGTGAHTVRFSTTTPDLTVTSATVNVVAGAAANIVASSPQNQSAPVLATVSAPPSVRVTDAGGNPVSGRAVVFTVVAGEGTTTPASGGSINTNADGVATLTQWRLGASPGLNRVLATATGLTGSPITFDATATIGAPTQLAVITQPAGAVSGRVFTTQPVVDVRDVAGNRVSGATSAVTATISSGNGTLIGTTTVNAVNGVATFTNLRVDGPGAHQLRFSAAGLTAAESNSFTVTQVANALQMQTQPAGASSGVPFTTQPIVRILDDAGILVTTGGGASLAVTVVVNSGTGTLGGLRTVNAVNGVASFTNLTITGGGAHTLRFTTVAPALAVNSASFTVGAGAATTIAANSAVSQTATVGTAVSEPPSVRVTDAGGNPVSGVNVTFTVTSGNGVTVPASGSTIPTNASGIATLTSWTLGATVGVNTIAATAAGLTGSPVTFTATGTVGGASTLAILTQPDGAVSGVVLTTQPVVEIRDATGNRVTTATNAVTATVASGTGVLVGTATVNAVNGVATFTNLRVDGSGAHTLRFAAAGLSSATSASFTVTQVATSLVVQTQPAGAASGVAFTTQPVVRILDNAGLVVTSGAGATLAVTAAIQSGTGTLGGTLSVNAVAGVATFTNLAITGSGSHVLRFFTATPALVVNSASFSVAAPVPVATQLTITRQPAGAVSGVVLTTQPRIEVRDANGNRVTTATNAITATIATGSGTLVGTQTINAVNGIATFSNLRIDGRGAHTLRFAAAGLTAATSSSFTVTQVAASLSIQTQPAGAVSGRAFTTQPVVRILDNAGLVVTTGSGATLSVIASISNGNGTLNGTTSVSAVAGVVTFTNLRIIGNGNHRLRFRTVTPALEVISGNFSVTSGTPTQLSLVTQPDGAVSGVVMATQPVVEVRDADGFLVTTATDPVAVAIATGAGALVGTQTVNATNGVATFTDLRLDGAGAHTLAFTAAGLSAATSNNFTVAQIAASLSVQTQPDGAVSGDVFTTQPVVRILDNAGRVVVSGDGAILPVTATIASGGGSLGGTVTVNAVNGVATFSSLAITGIGVHSLAFATDSPALSAVSASFSVAPAVPEATQLAISTQPAGAVSGVTFVTQPIVQVRDANGAVVTSATNAVTAKIATGDGTLVGTQTVNAVNGVATFNNLRIDGSGVHSLTFTATGLTTATSTNFTVTQVAASLAVQTQPAGATSGEAFATQPVVRLLDNAGLLVTTGAGATLSVTTTIASGSGTLGGTTSVNAVAGVATFTNLSITGSGAHTLAFSTTTPSLSVVSTSFDVAPAAPVATQLALTTQPGDAVSGLVFNTQPIVEVRDASGDLVPTATNAVTVTIASGDGALVGTQTVNAVAGVAAFTNLRLDGSGAHTLRFAATGLANVTSGSFTVTQVAASLAVQTQPAGATSGTAFTTQPIVRVLDNAGLLVTTGAGATLSVTTTIASGSGTLGGTTSVNAVAGVATFTNLSITGSGAHTLEFATATPALSVVSASFTVAPAAQVATQLAITTQPGGAVSGVAFTAQPVVQVRDVNGDLVTTAGNAVTVAIATGTGSLVGTQTVNAVNGVATFTNLRIDGAGVHSLTFTSTGLSPATSNNVTVTQVAAALDITTQPAGAVSGSAFTTQPVVRILDNAGLLITSGAAATLDVSAARAAGVATLSGALTVQASGGVATFTDLSFTETGLGAHRIEFTTATPPLTVTSAVITVVAGAADSIEAASVLTQNALVGTAVAAPPSVRVLDTNGNPVAGVKVAFAVVLGGGAIVPVATDTLLTNASGIATLTSWTLGAAPGENTVTATAVGLVGSPVTFTATATAPPDAATVHVAVRQYSRQASGVATYLISERQRVER